MLGKEPTNPSTKDTGVSTPKAHGKVPNMRPMATVLAGAVIVFILGIFLAVVIFNHSSNGKSQTATGGDIAQHGAIPTYPPSPPPVPTPLPGVGAPSAGTNAVPNPATIYAGNLPNSTTTVGAIKYAGQPSIQSHANVRPTPIPTAGPEIIDIVSGTNALVGYVKKTKTAKDGMSDGGTFNPTSNLLNGLDLAPNSTGISPENIKSQMQQAQQAMQAIQQQEQQLTQAGSAGTLGINTGMPGQGNPLAGIPGYPTGATSADSNSTNALLGSLGTAAMGAATNPGGGIPSLGSTNPYATSGGSTIPTIAVRQPGTQGTSASKKLPEGIGVNPYPFVPTKYECTLYAGTDIPAVLLTAVDSDAGGLITANIPRNVYDSVNQRCIVFPAGTRAIGYVGQNSAATGQSATYAVWVRMIYPPSKRYPYGGSLQLMNFPGVGGQGETGIPSVKNNHIGQMVGPALLLTLLQAGVALTGGSYNSATNGVTTMTPGQAISQALAQQIASIGVQQTKQALNRPPTLSVRPGQHFFIRVVHDIVLASGYKP